MNKELALKTIENLKRDSLNCNVFSVYDYCDLSMQELLCTFFTKINQVVDATNKTVVIVDWLVNQGLSEEVAKKLNQWLIDGTLANIINETVFNELNTKIRLLETTSSLHSAQLTKMKTYKFNFGDYKINGVSDTDTLKAIYRDIDALPTLKTLPWNAITKGIVIIDLNDKNLIINETIGHAYGRLSNITLRNGSIKPSPDFNGTRLIEIGNGGHTYQNRIENIIFDGDKRINGVYLNDTLNATVEKCYFLDTPKGVYSESNCHESFVKDNYFMWADYQNTKGTFCVHVGADAHVTNNIGVGYNVGVDVTSNANVITHNHFYSMGEWGVLTHQTALANIITHNYFDGCSIKLAHGGYMSTVDNNNFIAMNNYSAVYLERTNPAAWLQEFKMTNNTIIPYNDITPTKQVNFNIQDNVATINNNVALTTNMVGALLYNGAKTQMCQVTEVIPPNKLKVKKFMGFDNGQHDNITLGNSNIAVFNKDYDWVTIIYDTLHISNNSVDNGFELTSGKINGVSKKLIDSMATMGDNIGREYIQVPCNFSGDKTIKFNKKPKHIMVSAIVQGGKGDSRGFTKFNQDTSITNTCTYVYDDTLVRYRSDSECVVLLCPDNQKMYVKVTEYGDDYIKLHFTTGSSSSGSNAHIDLQVF